MTQVVSGADGLLVPPVMGKETALSVKNSKLSYRKIDAGPKTKAGKRGK